MEADFNETIYTINT